ncbi:MAG: ferredoxin, partial [Candidatus Kryptoniota bacterium]
CGLCKNIAPDFFEYIKNVNSYFVIRQPQTKNEIELLRGTTSFCNSDAIRETSIPELEPILLGERKN